MVEKIIKITVQDGEVDALVGSLTEAGIKFDTVEKNVEKVKKSSSKLTRLDKVVRELDRHTGGWASKIFDLGKGLKDVTKELNLSKAALIGTGIGVFVAALGTIVAYWEEIVEYFERADEALQRQIDKSQYLQDILSTELELLEIKEKILETEGKATDEIIEKKKQIIKLIQAENESEIRLLETQLQRIHNQIKEVTLWERIKAYASGDIYGVGLIGGTEEELKKLKETTDALNKARIEAAQLELELAQINNPKQKAEKRPRLQRVDGITGEELDKEKEALNRRFEELFGIQSTWQEQMLDKQQEFANSEIAIRAAAEAERTRIEAAQAKYRELIAEREAMAKKESYMLAADGFAAASQLIGQETAAGKAFAVASTLISTYLSAQKAYQSQIAIPTPDAPARAVAAAAIAVAAGLANVKQILSTKIPGYEGSYGGVGASPSVPPAFNVVGASAQNQLNQALLERDNTPVEAYVVEGSVSTAEQLRRNKIVASSIG